MSTYLETLCADVADAIADVCGKLRAGNASAIVIVRPCWGAPYNWLGDGEGPDDRCPFNPRTCKPGDPCGACIDDANGDPEFRVRVQIRRDGDALVARFGRLSALPEISHRGSALTDDLAFRARVLDSFLFRVLSYRGACEIARGE